MSDESEVLESEVAAETEAASKIPIEDRTRMPPVRSRFMFVDIAALRAQQLRRGALPRVTLTIPDGEIAGAESAPKLERIAMQEVEDGLIVYDYPGWDVVEEAAAAEKTS